jgi:hypothetical protein
LNWKRRNRKRSISCFLLLLHSLRTTPKSKYI